MDLKVDVLALRYFLLGALRRDDVHLPTYTELARLFGGIPQGQGRLLNALAEECEGRGEPDLTCLVVGANRLPSKFEGQPVERGSDAEQRWRTALTALRSFDWPKLTHQ